MSACYPQQLPSNRHRLPTNRHRLPTNRHRFFFFITAPPARSSPQEEKAKPTLRAVDYEVFVYRHDKCVHVYARVWAGDCFHRQLCYSNNRMLCLQTFATDWVDVTSPSEHTLVYDRVPYSGMKVRGLVLNDRRGYR